MNRDFAHRGGGSLKFSENRMRDEQIIQPEMAGGIVTPQNRFGIRQFNSGVSSELEFSQVMLR